MTSYKQKFIIATKQEIRGFYRKLAWFSLHSRDLYFEMAGMLEGSHTSYHQDGRLWRTSPATNKRARFIKEHCPLEQFQGWYQLGLGMVLKSSLHNSPELKSKDRKHQVYQVDIDQFPSDALNLVAELLDPQKSSLLDEEEMHPPADAQVIKIVSSNPWIIVTILGHDHNLLVAPYDGDFKGVRCRHINKRYSASLPGSRYSFEAYKLD